jgi:hypothetical protein
MSSQEHKMIVVMLSNVAFAEEFICTSRLNFARAGV